MRRQYCDGCSQGGHEALSEAQRYPKDVNGILAGAPASIMTELNSVLHECTYDATYDTSGNTILDQPEANIVLGPALAACYPKVGLVLDYRACEQKFNLDSVQCSATVATNCLTPAQIGVVDKVHDGPISPSGQFLYPGGFTDDYFEQIEQLAPFWDATDPNLTQFDQDGGKLILWQGEADWSIPTAPRSPTTRRSSTRWAVSPTPSGSPSTTCCRASGIAAATALTPNRTRSFRRTTATATSRTPRATTAR